LAKKAYVKIQGLTLFPFQFFLLGSLLNFLLNFKIDLQADNQYKIRRGKSEKEIIRGSQT